MKAKNPGKWVGSPNDVPGFDKYQYMPDELKDENGMVYAYRDTAGNYYELGYRLHYMLESVSY